MIDIKGAREHNLDRIDLALPQNRLICFTGVSGSGKSSLAFDTIFAEKSAGTLVAGAGVYHGLGAVLARYVRHLFANSHNEI